MSGTPEKPVTLENLENQNQEKLDAILSELQSIQGKLKTLEELTHPQRGIVQPPENKFVLRHVFKFSEVTGQPYESCYEDHFDASWSINVCEYGDHLSVYLRCEEPTNKKDWSVEISLEVRLINPNGTSARKSGRRRCFTKTECSGWYNLIVFNSLKNDYVVNNEFIVEIHVTVIKTTGVSKQVLRSFDDEEFSDVALLVNEKKFHVSKLFLASQSNYFKALFLGSFEESKKSEIKLRGVDENDMQQFLEVLYGEPAVNDMTVEGILLLADMHDTNILVKKCGKFLLGISKKTLKKKLEMAVRYNLYDLKNKCLSEIKTIADIRSVVPGCINQMDPSVMAVILEKVLALV